MRRRRVRCAPARTVPRPFRQAANDCGASDRPRWRPSGRRHAVSYEPSLDETGPGSLPELLGRLALRPGRRLLRRRFFGLLARYRHQHLLLAARRLAWLLGGFRRLGRFGAALADHREGIMADFAVGPQVVRAADVARINLVPRHELIDLDGAGGFQGDVFEFFLGDLYVGVGVNLEGLDDVFARVLLAGLGIHAAVFNAVASVSVDLIEADLFGIGGGRVQLDRTGDEGQTKETFPIGSRGHTQNSVSGRLGFKTIGSGWFRHPALSPAVIFTA